MVTLGSGTVEISVAWIDILPEDPALTKAMTQLSTRLKHGNVDFQYLEQLVDIFTPPYNQARVEQSQWFELSPDPVPGKPDIFEAKPS